MPAPLKPIVADTSSQPTVPERLDRMLDVGLRAVKRELEVLRAKGHKQELNSEDRKALNEYVRTLVAVRKEVRASRTGQEDGLDPHAFSPEVIQLISSPARNQQAA